MKRIVISTLTENHSLFWNRLFLDELISFRDRFTLRRTGNDFLPVALAPSKG